MKDVQGIQRGKCNSCKCIEYRAPEDSGKYRCDYCNHTPGEHVEILELGACKTCGKSGCDRYSSEEPNSYTDCQYCGCPASQHEGSDALRRTQPKPQPQPQPTAAPPTASAAYTTAPVTAVTGHAGVPPPTAGQGYPGFAARTSAAGVPVQSQGFGRCSFPGCPFPKRKDEHTGKVFDYCSKTCSQKDGQVKASFHQQKIASAQQAAVTSGTQPVMPQAHSQQQVPQVPQTQPPSRSTMPAAGMCKKCGVNPPNSGRSWCEACYRASVKT